MILHTLSDTRGDSIVIVLARRKSLHEAKKIKLIELLLKLNAGVSRGSTHEMDEYYPDSKVEINPVRCT